LQETGSLLTCKNASVPSPELPNYAERRTQDGTQYFFGRHKRCPSDTAVTNSVLTVPVFGNQAGEPCNNAAGFASSWCYQAYRWNLDYVVDPHGNSMTYVWSKLTGRYGLNGNTAAVLYDLSASLDHIDYGTRAGSEAGGSAPARVVFATAGRCSGACVIPTDYPDTPWDLYCATTATSCPGLLSPTFFNPNRLASVTALVWNPASLAYRNVDQWVLTHTFPPSGDNIPPAGNDTSPNLWLDSLTHTGFAADGSSLAEPAVHFGGTAMANMVDWGANIGVSPYAHYRLTSIVNGMGGQTLVEYSTVECPRPDAQAELRRQRVPVLPAVLHADPGTGRVRLVQQVRGDQGDRVGSDRRRPGRDLDL